MERLLLEKESGIRGLRIEWTRIHMPPASREIILAQPQRDARHLWNLLRPKLENLHLGYGVEAITATAFWTEKMPHRQTPIENWPPSSPNISDDHDTQYASFIDMLINRWGGGGKSQRVLQAHPVPSHTPEVARDFQPVGSNNTNDEARMTNGQNKSRRSRSSIDSSSVMRHSSFFQDRPSTLLEHPEEADVIALAVGPSANADPVARRRARHHLRHRSRTHRHPMVGQTPRHPQSPPAPVIITSVQTPAGTWVWLFRELESGKWYVHGLWS